MNDNSTLLIVDDDQATIGLLTYLFEKDHSIATVNSGEAALEWLADHKPDVILLDVALPGMDGYELLRRLKGHEDTNAIPVIFVSSQRDDEAESRGLEGGAMDFLPKPVRPQVALARVRNQVELKRARDELSRLATTDGLTGLANRRTFDRVLQREQARLVRTGDPLSLILLDVDHFKAFNDRYGHVAGDECLRRVGGVIATVMRRAPDLAARYGGEEFACILPETDAAGARRVAQVIVAAISGLGILHATSSCADHVTASLGVISGQLSPGISASDLLEAADRCLYQAKADGRNRFVTGDLPLADAKV